METRLTKCLFSVRQSEVMSWIYVPISFPLRWVCQSVSCPGFDISQCWLRRLVSFLMGGKDWQPWCEGVQSHLWESTTAYFINLLALLGHECVSGSKLIVECDDSFKILTASDKCLPCPLHELLAAILALIIFWEAFQPQFSAVVLFQLFLLSSSVHFHLKKSKTKHIHIFINRHKANASHKSLLHYFYFVSFPTALKCFSVDDLIGEFRYFWTRTLSLYFSMCKSYISKVLELDQ